MNIYNHSKRDKDFFINKETLVSTIESSSFHWNRFFNEPKIITNKKEQSMHLPTGWDGPLIGYYLPKNASNKSFLTLIEAMELANTIPKCKGITMNRNGIYKLRCMFGGKPVKTSKNDISWIKSNKE